ncbi:hypothetical protein J6590_034067 [Homalodisca vitripennis]|nr:hypothetical protein J6590_034067 [Homalodisca vitripennis]
MRNSLVNHVTVTVPGWQSQQKRRPRPSPEVIPSIPPRASKSPWFRIRHAIVPDRPSLPLAVSIRGLLKSWTPRNEEKAVLSTS